MGDNQHLNGIDLRILLYKENNDYVAHCLEFDVVHTSTESIKAASDELHSLLKEYMLFALKNDMIDTLYNPAPSEYWIMYHKLFPYISETLNDSPFKDRDLKTKSSSYKEPVLT